MAGVTKLYGVCRDVGYCVDTCGLCKLIPTDGSREPREKREPFILQPENLAADELEEIKPPPRKRHCEKCGKVERSNHKCKLAGPPKPPRFTKADRAPLKAKYLPKPRITCPACGGAFSNPQNLETHNRYKHQDNIRPPGAIDELRGEWEVESKLDCGCLIVGGKKVKYCDKHFSERE